jgi:hypothetical protein
MAQFQAYNKLLISQNEEILNYKVGEYTLGYVIHCQYPSYRGTYLSCIESMNVYVDGEEIPEEKIYFNLNGKQFLLKQFQDLYKEYWFILNKAKLLILVDGGLKQGSRHNIEIKMSHKIPYTGYFGSYLVLAGDDKKTLEVKGEVNTL